MKKLLTVSALGLLIGFSSCDKDDEKNSSDFSKTDAKAQISEFNSSATADLQELASSEGLEAIVDLSQLTDASDPFGGRLSTDKKKIKVFLRKKGHTFRTIINKNSNSSGRTKEEGFDFDSNTGVYTWNNQLEDFEITGSSDIIKIQFPTEGSATNNAELQLKAYEETGFYDAEWQEYTYEPTLIDASLLVDGTEAAALNLEASYDEGGFPKTGDLTVKVTPFTAHVEFDVTASDRNSLSASLTRAQETLFSSSVVVLYSASTKTEEDIKTVSGHVQMINLKLEGSIDVEGMDNAQGDDVDLNDFMDLKITSDNKKVGDIVFKTEMVDGYEESIPYIKYADGTEEKLETVLQPVVDELDEIDAEING